jgi:hypothetical protein
MAKHRELASVMYDSTLGRSASSKIWRTVVFAGAMLAAPMVIGCGGKKTEPTTPDKGTSTAGDGDKAAGDKATADKAAADKAAADKAAADQAAADKAAADKAAADQAAADQAAADKAAADEAAAKKKRPRGGGERPTGRGFVLA